MTAAYLLMFVRYGARRRTKVLKPWRAMPNHDEHSVIHAVALRLSYASVMATNLATVLMFRAVVVPINEGSLSLDRPIPSG